MLIGLYTLIMMLLGGGSTEIFYVDNLEKGVKKYVDDKDTKKEILDTLKWTTKSVEAFRKDQEKQVKSLKEMNLNIYSTEDSYELFFEKRIEARSNLYADVIQMRSYIQQKFSSTEWKNIMDLAQDEVSKQDAKEKKQADKGKKPKNIFIHLENSINENITDQDRKIFIIEALSFYEQQYQETVEALGNIDVENIDLLSDQNATKEDMHLFHVAIEVVRSKYYASYIIFYFVLKANTTEEEWEPVIKQFNKVL
jgi:hypothetical protein